MAICGRCGQPFHGTRCKRPYADRAVVAVAEKAEELVVVKRTPAEIRAELKKVWGKAIIQTDQHARACKRCFKRKISREVAIQTGALASIDPFKPCREALELWESEVTSRRAYLTAGGTMS